MLEDANLEDDIKTEDNKTRFPEHAAPHNTIYRSFLSPFVLQIAEH